MLRSAISAFTRVLGAPSARYAFAAWCAADPGSTLASIDVGPGSAEQRDRTTLRIAGRALHRVRDTRNLLSQRWSDLPVGRFVDRAVQPLLQKYFAMLVGQIISTNSRHPVPHRGAFRDRHGRRARDAVDAAAFCARWDRRVDQEIFERSTARGRETLLRTAKSCGPDAPTLVSSLAEFRSARPGSDKNISAR
jgi:hypothetical protein